MSEQEKKSGASTGASSVVVMEQSAGSRHKQPYRPTDLQEEGPDPHHKRSRAPAVPSVAGDLKKLTEGTGGENVEAKKDSERAISSEKFKHNVAKKLSSSIKKVGSMPDSVTLATLEVDNRKGSLSPLPQPIPAEVETVASASGLVSDKIAIQKENKADEDSITEEADDLRIDVKHSEWDNKNESGDCNVEEDDSLRELENAINDLACSSQLKKKEVSWDNEEYLEKVHLKDMGELAQAVPLERKASVGPCRSRTLYEGPSGISLWVPKKSTRIISTDINLEQAGINIIISKRYSPSESKSGIHSQKSSHQEMKENKAVKVEPDIPYLKIITALRGKYVFMRSKIKNVLNL